MVSYRYTRYTSDHTLKNGKQCQIILVVTPDSVGSLRSKDLLHVREIFEQLGIQKNMYALIINKCPPGLEQQGVDKESLLLNWDSEMSIPANCPKKPIQCLKLHSDKTNWKRQCVQSLKNATSNLISSNET